MRVLQSPSELLALVGQDVATSEWITVTQEQVQQFAEATGDRQWIHLDEERARSGPFGSTVAHGYLTLSLLPALVAGALEVRGVHMAINYGLNKVRFPAPVPVGSRLRAQLKLLGCDAIDAGGLQVAWLATIEREGSDRPVCVAETLARLYPQADS
ncbi:MaoC family dehydratase [Ramlibacter sp. AN1015]|uniref:MaoC family dehydratase n=1 Tax=Ramlibacter sp. AN1015 TaxID=3133428 RepID=UPI0030BD8CEA